MELLDKFQILFNRSDSHGNSIRYCPESSKLYTQCQYDSSRERDIGRVYYQSGEIVYEKFEDEKDIYRKTQAWSVIHAIAKQVDRIVYKSPKNSYQINRRDAYLHGELFAWDEKGLGKKVYIPLNYWDIESLHSGELPKLAQKLGQDWYNLFKDFLASPEFNQLGAFLYERRKSAKVFPLPEDMFSCFKMCPVHKTRVVFIGDAPERNAFSHGLSYSLKMTDINPHKQIDELLNRLEQDIYEGFMLKRECNLSSWAYQGVLLLNESLSSEKSPMRDHKDRWEFFYTKVLECLFARKQSLLFVVPQGVDFPKELPNQHSRVDFEDPKLFSKINAYLKTKTSIEISF